MDNPSGLGSEGMLPVGPGPDFVGADGEERDEPERPVTDQGQFLIRTRFGVG